MRARKTPHTFGQGRGGGQCVAIGAPHRLTDAGQIEMVSAAAAGGDAGMERGRMGFGKGLAAAALVAGMALSGCVDPHEGVRAALTEETQDRVDVLLVHADILPTRDGAFDPGRRQDGPRLNPPRCNGASPRSCVLGRRVPILFFGPSARWVGAGSVKEVDSGGEPEAARLPRNRGHDGCFGYGTWLEQ